MKKSRKVAVFKLTVIILACVLLIAGCVFVVYKNILKSTHPMKQTELVDKYSEEYEIEKSLVYAVIKTESGFNEKAKSNAGALGLTQMTPETFKWLQTKTNEQYNSTALYKPDVSVKYGCLFLSMLLDEFGNTKTAIAAYHAGRGQVNEWLKSEDYSKDGKMLDVIPSKSTAHYVSKVLKANNVYKNLYHI